MPLFSLLLLFLCSPLSPSLLGALRWRFGRFAEGKKSFITQSGERGAQIRRGVSAVTMRAWAALKHPPPPLVLPDFYVYTIILVLQIFFYLPPPRFFFFTRGSEGPRWTWLRCVRARLALQHWISWFLERFKIFNSVSEWRRKRWDAAMMLSVTQFLSFFSKWGII